MSSVAVSLGACGLTSSQGETCNGDIYSRGSQDLRTRDAGIRSSPIQLAHLAAAGRRVPGAPALMIETMFPLQTYREQTERSNIGKQICLEALDS